MKRWMIQITQWKMSADGSGTGSYLVNTHEGRFQPNTEDMGLSGMAIAKMLETAQNVAWFSGDKITIEMQIMEDPT